MDVQHLGTYLAQSDYLIDTLNGEFSCINAESIPVHSILYFLVQAEARAAKAVEAATQAESRAASAAAMAAGYQDSAEAQVIQNTR